MSSKPKSKEVSVGWQMLFAVIIFVNFWAAYRIQKLRRFLLLWLILQFGVGPLVTFFVRFPYSFVVYLAIHIPIVVYYMRKWSIQWNNQLRNMS